MSDDNHIQILKLGVVAWNLWRRENPEERPDLTGALLMGTNLARMDLGGARLRDANLRGTDLSESNLSLADVSEADLTGAKLVAAVLVGTDLSRANLTLADFTGAELLDANLPGAKLINAKLIRADLSLANLEGADLGGADFANVLLNRTVLLGNDLSTVKNLQTVRHRGHSKLGIDTLNRSSGKIPDVFLRAAGVPDDLIHYAKSLSEGPDGAFSPVVASPEKAGRMGSWLWRESMRG